MVKAKYDFSGWATRNDLLCSDGRTIRSNAFIDQDGQTVPLVWQHNSDSPSNVIGHALLENREDGVYAYGSFNNTDMGQDAKTAVQHGDITALSIYANKLKQRAGDVIHGRIKEVSLVLAGANPGAYIDVPIIAHSGEPCEDEAVIYTGEEIYLMHDEEYEDDFEDEEYEEIEEVEREDSEDVEDEEDEESIEDDYVDDEEIEHTDEGKTVQDVWNEFTDDQKKVVGYLIDQAMQEDEEDVEHSDDYEGENEMKYNIFENEEHTRVLSHAERADLMKTIVDDGKRLGSLKESFLQHMEDGCLSEFLQHDDEESAVAYGIEDIDYLFPDAKNLDIPPEFIKRDTGWVSKVINGASHSPISRVKSMFADITEDEARAKGYIKGNLKKEEVFSLLKRTTSPQTIYKKQKMDRDDMIDITDFDVIPWLKGEMRMMLEEEMARAMLVGDGRLSSDDDKISEDHIRPIYNDADLFTVKVGVATGADDASTADQLIEEVIRNRRYYKGSGEPTFFTTDDWISEMLLLKDGLGHRLYKTIGELATALRCKEIVPCEAMEGVKFQGHDLIGVMVNMSDYRIGADKGGAVSMFDDFDIDYNQMKYLIETRCSAALRKPFSAMTFYKADTRATTGRNIKINGTDVVGTTGSTGA